MSAQGSCTCSHATHEGRCDVEMSPAGYGITCGCDNRPWHKFKAEIVVWAHNVSEARTALRALNSDAISIEVEE